jgi:hypothetical protein
MEENRIINEVSSSSTQSIPVCDGNVFIFLAEISK